MNAAFSHGTESDDFHPASSLKCGSALVPTALSVGEREDASGAEFLLALVAGMEVMARLGLAALGGIRRRGLHPTGSTGAIGAASVAGRLMGLDEPTLHHALTIAALSRFGYSEIPSEGRGNVKRLFPGMAAAAGVRAAQLAAIGVTAPPKTFGDAKGFSRAFEVDAKEESRLISTLGQEWETLNVRFKLFAQDGYIQPMTEATRRLMTANDIDFRDIDQVRVGVSHRACNEVAGVIRSPRTITDAQFSASFSLALFMVAGTADYSAYSLERLSDPVILGLEDRISVYVDDDVETRYQASRPRGAKVAIRLRSGVEFSEYVADLPEMTEQQLEEKCQRLVRPRLGAERTEELLHTALNIDRERSLGPLGSLLAT